MKELVLSEKMQLAKAASDSKMFGCTAEQALMKMLLGEEMGIPPATSLAMIHIIANKPVMPSHLIAAKIQQNGVTWKFLENSNSCCKMEFFSPKKESLGVFNFSIEDAERAELLKNPSWKKYPRSMLFARCITLAGRELFPAMFLPGCYTPEEIETSTTTGPTVIDGHVLSRDYSYDELKEVEEISPVVPEPPTPQLQERKIDTLVLKRIHAQARECGLSHEDLHSLFGCESLKELSDEKLEKIPNQLENMLLDEVSQKAMQEVYLALTKCKPAEISECWRKQLPAITSLNSLHKFKLIRMKDELKQKLLAERKAAIISANNAERDGDSYVAMYENDPT